MLIAVVVPFALTVIEGKKHHVGEDDEEATGVDMSHVTAQIFGCE